MQGTGRARARGSLITGQRPFWVAGLALGASQGAAWLVGRQIPPGAERVLVPHVLSLTVLHNRGVAFGLLAGVPPLTVVALALTVLTVVFYNRGAWPGVPVAQWGLGLTLGGACGNIVDRLRFGYVVDYVDLHVWPVFNLADTAIVLGAGLLLLALAKSGDPRG